MSRSTSSDFALTRSLDAATLASLREAAIEVLSEWTERLRKEAGPTLPRPT